MRHGCKMRVAALAASLGMFGCSDPIQVNGSGTDTGLGATGSASTTSTTSSSSTSGSDPSDDDRDDDSVDVSSTTEPIDCDGCVNAGGVCEAGTFDTACGFGGAACMPCEAPATCAEGVCLEPPSCDETNCDGCCDGDTCVAAPNEAQCGLGGSECSACEESASCQQGVCRLPCELVCDGCCTTEGECIDYLDQDEGTCGFLGFECEACGGTELCDFGLCISETCAAECDGCCDGDTCLPGDATSACGSDGSACFACADGLSCEASQCVPDSQAEWELTLLSGEVAPTDPDGLAWDAFGGAPDPYLVVMEFGFQSSAPLNTLEPAWNQLVTDSVTTQQLTDGLEFALFDDDVALDDTMGTCTIPFDEGDFGGTAQLTCSVDGFDYWTISFSITAAN